MSMSEPIEYETCLSAAACRFLGPITASIQWRQMSKNQVAKRAVFNGVQRRQLKHNTLRNQPDKKSNAVHACWISIEAANVFQFYRFLCPILRQMQCAIVRPMMDCLLFNQCWLLHIILTCIEKMLSPRWHKSIIIIQVGHGGIRFHRVQLDRVPTNAYILYTPIGLHCSFKRSISPFSHTRYIKMCWLTS